MARITAGRVGSRPGYDPADTFLISTLTLPTSATFFLAGINGQATLTLSDMPSADLSRVFVRVRGLTFATLTAPINFEVLFSTGSTYSVAGYSYEGQSFSTFSTATAFQAGIGNSATSLKLNGSLTATMSLIQSSTATGSKGVYIDLTINEVGRASPKFFTWDMFGIGTASGIVGTRGHGWWSNPDAPINSVQFRCLSGSFDGGVCEVWGQKSPRSPEPWRAL